MAQNDRPVIVTLTCEAREGTATTEIDRAEWEARSPVERRAMVEDLADEHVSDQGGFGWYIDDPDDNAMVGHPDDTDPDPLRELHDKVVELHRDQGSSNDWVQVVDDWFVAHGYPTIIYGS